VRLNGRDGEVIQFGAIPLQAGGALLPIGAVKIFHPAQYAVYCSSCALAGRILGLSNKEGGRRVAFFIVITFVAIIYDIWHLA